MKKIDIIGKGREEARNIIIKLPREQEFLINTLKDGRKVFIRTDGEKTSKVNGRAVEDIDITVHYDNEKRKLIYIDDLLVDAICKKWLLGKEKMLILVKALKKAIELKPLDKVYEEHPELREFEKMNLPGYSIDFLLKVIPVLALQEDVNYWGKRYAGRYKPYNALCDLLIHEMSLKKVIEKHKLIKEE